MNIRNRASLEQESVQKPELIQAREALWQCVAQWRREGQRIGLVPTMGNLHQGHLSLVQAAQRNADKVIVSIFVNPTQFGPSEDFELYPRTLASDMECLREFDVDAVFAPDAAQIYPHGHDQTMLLQAPLALGDTLCGLARPGHFNGVVTVVSRLFNLVQPDIAVFGEKDYQQLRIIEYMNEELGYPLEILRAPTMREDSGLAMSSRNQYLDSQQRQRATAIYQTLNECVIALKGAESPRQLNLESLEEEAIKQLKQAGLEPEYFAIRRADNLQAPNLNDQGQESSSEPPSIQLRILAAARMGSTRLIDNLPVTIAQ